MNTAEDDFKKTAEDDSKKGAGDGRCPDRGFLLLFRARGKTLPADARPKKTLKAM
jgi:hypothetical protein